MQPTRCHGHVGPLRDHAAYRRDRVRSGTQVRIAIADDSCIQKRNACTNRRSLPLMFDSYEVNAHAVWFKVPPGNGLCRLVSAAVIYDNKVKGNILGLCPGAEATKRFGQPLLFVVGRDHQAQLKVAFDQVDLSRHMIRSRHHSS